MTELINYSNLIPAEEYPVLVLDQEQFTALVNCMKYKLFCNLELVPVTVLTTRKVVTTKTTRIGRFTLQESRDEQVTESNELPKVQTFDPDVYTVQELWRVVSKQRRFRRFRVMLMGRRVKSGLSATAILEKISKRRRLRPVINRDDVARWVVIRKSVYDKLSEEKKAEWALVTALMVVSRGGILFEVSDNQGGSKSVTAEGSSVASSPPSTTSFQGMPAARARTKDQTSVASAPVVTATPVVKPSSSRSWKAEKQPEQREKRSLITKWQAESPKLTEEKQPLVGKRHGFSPTVARGNAKQDRENASDTDFDYDSESESEQENGYDQVVGDSKSPALSSSGSRTRQHENMSPIDWVAFCE